VSAAETYASYSWGMEAGWRYGAASIRRYGLPYAVYAVRRAHSNAGGQETPHMQGWLRGAGDAVLSALNLEV